MSWPRAFLIAVLVGVLVWLYTATPDKGGWLAVLVAIVLGTVVLAGE